MTYRIVSTGVLGFLLLTASACSLTIQSGPSSPAYMGYAPAAAAPQNPVYVPVAANPPPRAPGSPVVVASPAPPSPAVAPRPSVHNEVVIARAPTSAPPRASLVAPRGPSPAPAPAPKPAAKPIRELGRLPVFPSMPAAHTPATAPVSATGVDARLPLPDAPGPRALAPKPAASRTLESPLQRPVS